MNDSIVDGSKKNSSKSRSLPVKARDSLHNLLDREHSVSPARRILPFNRETVRQISSIRPFFDDSSTSSPKNSAECDTEGREASTSSPTGIGRPESTGLSGSSTKEILHLGQAIASTSTAPSTNIDQPNIARPGSCKIPSAPVPTPVPTRKNSRTFFSFKKESVPPLLSSFRTPANLFSNMDSKNKERQQQAHTRQEGLNASRRRDRPSNKSVDISSFSFPQGWDETPGRGGIDQRKGKEVEHAKGEEVLSVDGADKMEEIGKPFDVCHALHVESDDLAVLPLEWVDALKAQGSTPAEILQLAVSKSKSHILRQNSINLPIPIRPKSPPSPPLPPPSPLPPLPHRPVSPSGRHSRSNSLAPARSWIPLSGGRTENIRSRLAKRMTKSNSLLFGSSLLGGPRASSDLPASPSETALNSSTPSASPDVTPIKITSPIVVSRKSCVLLSPSFVSSPTPSSAPPLSSPQSPPKRLSPHMRMSSISSMSPRLSLDFDVGSFQVPIPPSSTEYSTNESAPDKNNIPLDPQDDLSERSAFLVASHQLRSSFLSFSSSISGSFSSESSPPSVHLSTPGQTRSTAASPSVQTSTPSVFYQTDTSGWPQPGFADVRGLSKVTLAESDSAVGWEERWDQGRRGEKRADVEVDEEIDSADDEEGRTENSHLPSRQDGNSRLEQGDLFMFGRSFSKTQGPYQADRSDDSTPIRSGRPLSLAPSQSKSKRSSTQTSYSKHSSSYSISSAGSSQEAVISKAILVRNTFLVSDVTVSNSSSA